MENLFLPSVRTNYYLSDVYPEFTPESYSPDSQQGNVSSLALEFTLSLSPRDALLTRSRGVCAYLLVCRGSGASCLRECTMFLLAGVYPRGTTLMARSRGVEMLYNPSF